MDDTEASVAPAGNPGYGEEGNFPVFENGNHNDDGEGEEGSKISEVPQGTPWEDVRIE